MTLQFNQIVLLGTATGSPTPAFTATGKPYATLYVEADAAGSSARVQLRVSIFKPQLLEWSSQTIKRHDMVLVSGRLTSWVVRDRLCFGVIADSISRLVDKVLESSDGDTPQESLV